MTDTNNTDGAALLPVTQSDRDAAADAQLARGLSRGEARRLREGDADEHWLVQAFARHRQSHSLPGDVGTAAINQNDAMRQELAHVGNLISDLARAMGVDQANDDGSWPDLAGRIEKLTRAALTPSPLPATQEDAERSGAGMEIEKLLQLIETAHEHANEIWIVEQAAKVRAALDEIPTPQRQEYDGEAVREALEQNRGPLADAARQIAVRFGVGGEGQASAYAAAKDAILAALAHPVQATPSALSGDAGEGETLRDALAGFGDDYMTSEKHHPGYVLIPTGQFERIRAALKPTGGNAK